MTDQYLLAIMMASAIAHLFGLTVLRLTYYRMIECWFLSLVCALSCLFYAQLIDVDWVWNPGILMSLESLRSYVVWRFIKKRLR